MEVLNQPPPLAGYDVVGCDPALTAGIDREGAGWAAGSLGDPGWLAGSTEAARQCRELRGE